MQVRIREFVRTYNELHDATVILTSHYMADVTALCERIVVIDKGKIKFDGDLSALIENASPAKIIKLQLSSETPRHDLERFGTVNTLEGLNAELSVPRAEVSSRSAQMLSTLPIADITIEDPPIEEIIGELFNQKVLEAEVV
jgi:ABC-2 type transport system ATP-binding protein